ncbi:MAG: bifunctional precorrin-2 dehydrogenase/sirohydrochlorin ferrochelatase [Rubrobacter sp.]|nr:bifunctional precorrin-2 dehydrogenase/sirohydrochlorin ferrochelatase [Rubrobacter sp.]
MLVGGGEVANRKARKLLQAGAKVLVISPEVKPELASVAAEVRRRPYRVGDLEGAFLVFAATEHREVNAAVAQEARERGIPVNVADKLAEGDFALPSTLRRGRLQVAVSTGGASPTLARRIRQELENAFGFEWASLVEALSSTRRDGHKAEGELEEVVEKCLSRLRV